MSEEPAKSEQDEELQNPGGSEEHGESGAYPGGDPDAGPDVEPGVGGYAGRDPATDMPRIPSSPETQDDPQSHDAAPDGDEERSASE